MLSGVYIYDSKPCRNLSRNFLRVYILFLLLTEILIPLFLDIMVIEKNIENWMTIEAEITGRIWKEVWKIDLTLITDLILIIVLIQIIDRALNTRTISHPGIIGITRIGKWTTELRVVARDPRLIRGLLMAPDLRLNIQSNTKVRPSMPGVVGKHNKDWCVVSLDFSFSHIS